MKNMKKTIVLLAMFCLCFQAVAVSAATPDFSGVWELDASQSKLPDTMDVEAMTIRVVQTEKDLRIVDTLARSKPLKADGGGTKIVGYGGNYGANDYNLDGKETTANVNNEGMTGKVTRKAVVAPDGKLSLTAISNLENQMGSFTIKTNEIWELIDGGNTLKITRYMETPRGATNAEMFFKRKAAGVKTLIAGGDVGTAEGAGVGSAPGGTPKKISGGVLNGKALVLGKPEYPAAARAVKASGAVNVQITIDEQGTVIAASAVSGHPLLRQAAEQAARGAQFAPTMLQGVPVAVTGVLVYNFTP